MENHIEQQSGNDDRELGVYEALRNAAAEGDRATIQKLLAKGVDVNIANESGETAFSYACVNNQFETAVMLYERGADIHALDKDGASPLDWAKPHADDAFYWWLLDIGCKHELDGPPREVSQGNSSAEDWLTKLSNTPAEEVDPDTQVVQTSEVRSSRPRTRRLTPGQWIVSIILIAGLSLGILLVLRRADHGNTMMRMGNLLSALGIGMMLLCVIIGVCGKSSRK